MFRPHGMSCHIHTLFKKLLEEDVHETDVLFIIWKSPNMFFYRVCLVKMKRNIK